MGWRSKKYFPRCHRTYSSVNFSSEVNAGACVPDEGRGTWFETFHEVSEILRED